MGTIKLRLKIFLMIFFVVIALGTLGMMAIEKRSLIDSFYFVVVTMATVGYGDVHPVTISEKSLPCLSSSPEWARLSAS